MVKLIEFDSEPEIDSDDDALQARIEGQFISGLEKQLARDTKIMKKNKAKREKIDENIKRLRAKRKARNATKPEKSKKEKIIKEIKKLLKEINKFK